MLDKLPPEADLWGIREADVPVLLVIARWFNGQSLTIRGEKRRLATHHELPLEDMFRGTQWDYKQYSDAHQRFLENGFLEERYVARRKIDWSPTEQGRQAIQTCLTPWDDIVRPKWASESSSGPLYGDPDKGVYHRKGVEVAGVVLPQIVRESNLNTPDGRPGEIEWYPNHQRDGSCHDLHIDTNERTGDIGVEVISGVDNLDEFITKWLRYQNEDRLTFWIFDGRQTACQSWNELDSRRQFYLDGQFNNHRNWSARSINRKIWRSSNKYRGESTGDLIHTVTGLLEGDKEGLRQLFEEYLSTNNQYLTKPVS